MRLRVYDDLSAISRAVRTIALEQLQIFHQRMEGRNGAMMKRFWFLGLLILITACSSGKKKTESKMTPKDYEKVTDPKQRVSLTLPGLGWRKPEKTLFDFALNRDGSTVQIGIIIAAQTADPGRLLNQACKWLRLEAPAATSFQPWSENQAISWMSGSGNALVSKSENFTVHRKYDGYVAKNNLHVVLLFITGKDEDLSAIQPELTSIIKSITILK